MRSVATCPSVTASWGIFPARPDAPHRQEADRAAGDVVCVVGGPHYYDRIDTRCKDNAMKSAQPRPARCGKMPETIGGLRVTGKSDHRRL